jgi:Tol biopolymer transport system component
VDHSGTLSSDGTRIAYAWYDILYVSNLDGSVVTQVSLMVDVQEFNWMPDGKNLVYATLIDNTKGGELWIVNVDTRQKKKLANAIEATNDGMVGSPDGKYVLYYSLGSTYGKDKTLNWLQWVAPTDGSKPPVKIGYAGTFYRFSPDGDRIFLSGSTLSDGKPIALDIYTCSLDGSDLRKLDVFSFPLVRSDILWLTAQ